MLAANVLRAPVLDIRRLSICTPTICTASTKAFSKTMQVPTGGGASPGCAGYASATKLQPVALEKAKAGETA